MQIYCLIEQYNLRNRVSSTQEWQEATNKTEFLLYSVYFNSQEEIAAAAVARSLQSCPTLWDPIDSSPPDSPIPGIL